MVFFLVAMSVFRCVVLSGFVMIMVGVVGVIVLVLVSGGLSCVLFSDCCMFSVGCSVVLWCDSVCSSFSIGLFDLEDLFFWFVVVFVRVCFKVFWSA